MSKIITDSAKLDAHIVGVNKKANELNGAVQLALASAVFQAVYGRNTNHLNALAGAVGKGVRRSAIGEWILRHAPVMAEDNKDRAKENPFRFSNEKMGDFAKAHDWADYKKVSTDEALAYAEHVLQIDWTALKPDQLVPESFDVLEAFKALVKKAQTLQGKGTKIIGGEFLTKVNKTITDNATPDVQSV